MKTGSWSTYRGPGRVGISLGSPRGQPAGYRLYRALAPTRPMLVKMPREQYEPLYEAILAKLDPRRVWDDLHQLAGDGVEPVLLCFEKPPFTDTNYCHRRMAAAWLERGLGVEIAELETGA
jgi:hypothetical protein